jgi:hypothetical protein
LIEELNNLTGDVLNLHFAELSLEIVEIFEFNEVGVALS